MNSNTISAECGHRMHTACTYEDCACECHLMERMYDPWRDEPDYDDEPDRDA